MSLTDFQTIFSDYGILGVIFAAIVGLIYTKPETLKTVKKLFDSNVIITDTQLVNHTIFSQFDFWISQKISTLNFKSKFRNLVFRDYLTIYLKVHKQKIEEFVKSKKYESMHSEEIWNSFSELFDNIAKECETRMIDIGIPILVIDKMKLENSDYIELMRKLIQGISGSELYKSNKNKLKVFSVLNIICPVIESSIFHSEVVCTVLNGELTGMTYKGETEIKLQK